MGNDTLEIVSSPRTRGVRFFLLSWGRLKIPRSFSARGINGKNNVNREHTTITIIRFLKEQVFRRKTHTANREGSGGGLTSIGNRRMTRYNSCTCKLHQTDVFVSAFACRVWRPNSYINKRLQSSSMYIAVVIVFLGAQASQQLQHRVRRAVYHRRRFNILRHGARNNNIDHRRRRLSIFSSHFSLMFVKAAVNMYFW